MGQPTTRVPGDIIHADGVRFESPSSGQGPCASGACRASIGRRYPVNGEKCDQLHSPDRAGADVLQTGMIFRVERQIPHLLAGGAGSLLASKVGSFLASAEATIPTATTSAAIDRSFHTDPTPLYSRPGRVGVLCELTAPAADPFLGNRRESKRERKLALLHSKEVSPEQW